MPTSCKPEHFNVGDLVAFNFPFSDEGSKTRVCAIVAHDPEHDEVVVAYGSSKLCLKNNPDHALALTLRSEWQSAGLHRATRFQLDRRVRVKLGDPRFKTRQSLGTAKVGELPQNLTHRLGQMYCRLPSVGRAQETLGVHPKRQNDRFRTAFLRRRRPAAKALA